MSQTVQTKTSMLKVPGATIYYEVRGAGPALVLMPGGPADANTMSRLAGVMASGFTAVTYDPRGLSRSMLEGGLDGSRLVEIFAEDVHRLIGATTIGKADIFANSGGAVIALELAARHPEEIRTVVVHEPPSPALLPDPARVRAEMAGVVDTYRQAGIGPAMQQFMVMTGVRRIEGPPPGPQGEPTPEMPEAMARMQRNMDLFLGQYVLAIAGYEPDFGALKGASCRIVAAVGEESRGELAHEGGLALARRLGTEAVVFPGAHGGFDSHPVEFAKKLRQVLED